MLSRTLVPGGSGSSSASRALHSLATRRKQDLARENTATDDLTRKVLKAAVFGASRPSPADGYHSSYTDQGFKASPARGRPLNNVVILDQHRLGKQLEGRQRQSTNTKASREGLLRRSNTPSGARGFASAASLVDTSPQLAEQTSPDPITPPKNRWGKPRKFMPVSLVDARRIELGSFVEVRKNGVPTIGIYVGAPSDQTYNGRDGCVVLTTLGVFEVFPLENFTYSFPLISPTKAAECLRTYSDGSASSAPIRSTIQRLRQFAAIVDAQLGHLVARGAHDLYRIITTARPSLETVTAAGLIHFITPTPIKHDKELTHARHYAAHSLLMESPEHFIADAVEVRVSGLFLIRSPDALARLERVRDWVRARSPVLLAFATRAAAVREFGRRNPPVGVPSAGVKLELRPTPKELEWSDTDLVVLQFLRQSTEEQRETQARPHIPTAAAILKLVDARTAALVAPLGTVSPSQTRDDVLAFLSDVGVAAPWEDWVAHDERELYSEWERTSVFAPADKPDAAAKDAHASVRRDFGQLPVYAIDDAGAKELDDGISIEPATPLASGEPSWWVHVHVADPTALLVPSHQLALLARERDHTEYFPERTFPMIPEWFSARHHLSLGSPVDRTAAQRVLTFSSRVDATGTVLESSVEPAVVRNVKMLTYSSVDAVFGFTPRTGTKLYNVALPPEFDFATLASPSRKTDDALLLANTTVQADLRTLHELATSLGRQRVASSALAWFQPRAAVTVSPTLSPHHLLSPIPQFYATSPLVTYTAPPLASTSSSSSMSPSQFLVAEHMVAANRVAARFLHSRGLPAPFRSQPPVTATGDLSAVYAMRDMVTGEVPLAVPLLHGLSFGAAVTRPTAGPHAVMGIQDEAGYVRATSPLRRYGDMLVHWQIKAALLPRSARAAGPLFDDVEIARQINRMDLISERRGKISRQAEAFWALYVLRGKLGGEDEVARSLLGNLTCLPLRDAKHSGYDGSWSQPVIIPELGLRAQLQTRLQGEAPTAGVSANVKVVDIILSNRPRLLLELKP